MSLYDRLNFASGYYCIFPAGFRGLKETTLFFSEDCPENIKSKALKVWAQMKIDAQKMKNEGIYSHDTITITAHI